MPDNPVEADAGDDGLLEDEGEGGRKGGLILPLLVALLALGGGGGVGALFLGPTVAPMLVSDPSKPPKDKGGGHGGGHGEVVTNLLNIENLVVNPAGSGGTRLLLVSVALELHEPGLVDEIGARDVELRDALLRCFGTKTVDELTDVGQREALMEEIKTTLDHVVGEGVITKVFLPQYVIQ